MDKVRIEAISEEDKIECEICEKPQFMLKEDFNQQLIECAVSIVKAVCEEIYPNSKENQKMVAEVIHRNMGVLLE